MENVEADLWKDAGSILNASVRLLTGAQGTYRIFYWGATPGLLANQYHKHSFFEVCFCTRGSGTYREEEAEFQIAPGTAFCSRPEVSHQIIPSRDLDMYLLYVAFEVREEALPFVTKEAFQLLRERGPALIRQAENTSMAYLWLTLLHQASSCLAWERSSDVLKGTAYALINSFPVSFAADRMPKDVLVPSKSASGVLDQAKLYIRDNLGEMLSVEHVANYLHLSVRHLSRLFHQELNDSVGNFIRRERVRVALELLADSNYPIKMIAEKCGFGSIHYFTRIFQRETGWTPAKYRKACAKT